MGLELTFSQAPASSQMLTRKYGLWFMCSLWMVKVTKVTAEHLILDWIWLILGLGLG